MTRRKRERGGNGFLRLASDGNEYEVHSATSLDYFWVGLDETFFYKRWPKFLLTFNFLAIFKKVNFPAKTAVGTYGKICAKIGQVWSH